MTNSREKAFFVVNQTERVGKLLLSTEKEVRDSMDNWTKTQAATKQNQTDLLKLVLGKRYH